MSSGKTVLLVDYEPQSIDETVAQLEGAGYKVEVARDGVSGLEAFSRLKPDLVLSEAMLPRKHGFELCQTIKGSPEGKDTPVIIATGVYRGHKYRIQALSTYGCDEFIEKPVPGEELVAICRRLLDEESVDTDRPPIDTVTRAAPTRLEDLSEEELEGRLDAMLFGKSSAPDVGAGKIGDLSIPEEAPPGLGPPVDRAPTAPVMEAPSRPSATPPRPEARVLPHALPRVEPPVQVSLPPPATSWVGWALALVLVVAVAAVWFLWPQESKEPPSTSPGPATVAVAPALLPSPTDATEASDIALDERQQPVPARPLEEPRAVASIAPIPVTTAPTPSPPVPEQRSTVETSHTIPSEAADEAPAVQATESPAIQLPPEPRSPEVPVRAAPQDVAPIETTDELSATANLAASRRIHRGDLVPLEEVDTPPLPLKQSPPPYPPLARRLRQHGTVLLGLLIDEQGSVARVEIVRGIPASPLNDAAVRAVRDWTYEPATKDGVPVKVWKKVAIEFNP